MLFPLLEFMCWFLGFAMALAGFGVCLGLIFVKMWGDQWGLPRLERSEWLFWLTRFGSIGTIGMLLIVLWRTQF